MKTNITNRLVRLARTNPYQAYQAGAALLWLVGTRVLLGTLYQSNQAGQPLSMSLLVNPGNQAEPTCQTGIVVNRGKTRA